MQTVLNALIKELGTYHVGVANPRVFNTTRIQIENESVLLKSICQIGVKDQNTLSLRVYDTSNVKSIDEHFRNTDFTPSTIPPNLILLKLPKITREYRENLSKEISKGLEKYKQSVRSIRLSALKKEKDAPKDDYHRFEKEVNSIQETIMKQLEESVKKKKKEIIN